MSETDSSKGLLKYLFYKLEGRKDRLSTAMNQRHSVQNFVDHLVGQAHERYRQINATREWHSMLLCGENIGGRELKNDRPMLHALHI